MSAKNKNYDEEFVRESLECAICKDFFDEPKQLVCGHTFCRNCIERLDKVLHVRNDFGDHLYPIHHQYAVQCPQCRDMCIIPPSGLNTNYVVKEMVEKFRDIGVSHNRPSAATSSGGSHSKLSCEACKRQTLHEEMFLCRTCTVGQVDNKKIFLCGFCIVTRGHKDHEIIIYTDLAVNQDRQMAMSKVNESEMSVRAVGQRMKGIPLNIFHRLEDLLKQIHKLTKYFDTLRTQCLDAETTLTKQELDSKVKESATVAEHIGQAYSQLEKLKMENIQSIAAIASSVERYNLLPNTAAESSRNLIDFDSAMPSTSANALATHHVNCFAYSNDAALDVDKRRRAIIRGRNKARRTENVATDENAAAQIQPIVLD